MRLAERRGNVTHLVMKWARPALPNLDRVGSQVFDQRALAWLQLDVPFSGNRRKSTLRRSCAGRRDADEVAPADRDNAGHGVRGGEVGRPHDRTKGGRAQDLRRQHSRQGEVRREALSAGNDFDRACTYGRPARGAPLGRRHEGWSCRHHLDATHATQIAFAVPDSPGSGRCGPQVLSCARHRPAAEGAGVERTDVCVAHDEPHRLQRDAELFGHQQCESGPAVLSDVDLADESGHQPVRSDVDPGTSPGHRRVGPGRQDHDESVRQHAEVVAILGREEIPGAARAHLESRRCGGAGAAGGTPTVRTPGELRRPADRP